MNQTLTKHSWIGLIVLLVICFAAAGIGGAGTTPKIPGWYATLVKPSWNPPNWIFGPVWSALYCCMAGRLKVVVQFHGVAPVFSKPS